MTLTTRSPRRLGTLHTAGPSRTAGPRGPTSAARCAPQGSRGADVTGPFEQPGGFEHNGQMSPPGPAGLVVTPGASAGRDHSGLRAIDEAVTRRGIVTERVEFPGQASGRRRTDPPGVCMETVRAAASELAARLSVPTGRIAVGGRSFGGRMCSMAVAGGMSAAALVLVSYPLHPPGRPDKLRTQHFGDITVPCLFVSGRRDAFASPVELETETRAIAGPVTLALVEGDHSLRKGETDAAEIVASWLDGLK